MTKVPAYIKHRHAHEKHEDRITTKDPKTGSHVDNCDDLPLTDDGACGLCGDDLTTFNEFGE